jgi:hypothetical protein
MEIICWPGLAGSEPLAEAIRVKRASKRRQAWDFEPPLPAPSRRVTRDTDEPRSRSGRNVGIAVFLFLLIAVAAVCLVRFYGLDLNRLRSVMPAKPETAALPVQAKPTAAPQGTPVPVIHNSPDTTCDGRRQCSSSEFAELSDSLRRQWALTPEELRSKCANQSTYPAAEHCILSNSVSYMAKHADETAPWINPKNFDAAIMALCQKNPNSLALCSKP